MEFSIESHTCRYEHVSIIAAENVSCCYLGPVLAQTPCCSCSPLNIKEVSVPLTPPAAEIVWQPDTLTDSSKSSPTTALKTAKWLARPGILKWVCKYMGYWVTLSIAIAAAFHQSLLFTSSSPSLPAFFVFSLILKTSSACAACVFASRIRRPMSALSCLIESAQGFPDCVGWHVQPLLSVYKAWE